MISAITDAAVSLGFLGKVVDRCTETLKDPSASAEDRQKAEAVIRTANNLLARVRYVLETEDAAEMRKRFEEVGRLKAPAE